MEGWMGWDVVDCWERKIIKGIVYLAMWAVYGGKCLIILLVLMWMVDLSYC